jgi:hypothetical protein
MRFFLILVCFFFDACFLRNTLDTDESPTHGFFFCACLYLPRGRVLTPADVRGNYSDLRGALNTRGWPALAATRGLVMFDLDLWSENADCRAPYEALPLVEQLFFVRGVFDPRAPANESVVPTGGTVSIMDPMQNLATVTAMARAGWLVRTTGGLASESGDAARAQLAALRAAGVHVIASDQYGLPNVTDWRCNPVTAPPGCAADLAALLAPTRGGREPRLQQQQLQQQQEQPQDV